MTNRPQIEFRKCSVNPAKRVNIFVNGEYVGYVERFYRNPGRATQVAAYTYWDGSVKLNGEFHPVKTDTLTKAKRQATSILSPEN